MVCQETLVNVSLAFQLGLTACEQRKNIAFSSYFNKFRNVLSHYDINTTELLVDSIASPPHSSRFYGGNVTLSI